MKTIHVAALASLLALSGPLEAEQIRPGLWKISLESRVAESPDWKPEPVTMTQCLTESDAKNPDQVLLWMGAQGVNGCDLPQRAYSGNHLSFDLNCAGTLGLKGHGEIDFSATRVDGTMDVSFADSAQGGQQTAMQNKLQAEYLGACGGGAAGSAPALPGGLGAGVPSLPAGLGGAGLTPPAPPAN
jgi:hypothetical protein